MRNGSQVRQARAFTIIELMIVMAVIALLASVVTPRYFKHVERAKESTLRQNLLDRKSTRLNSSHIPLSRMPSSA